MIRWFTDYRDIIAGIAGIATAIGLLVTAVALVVAAIQIREQRWLNRANAVYEIQSDARELAWQLINDPILATAVYGDAPDKKQAAIGTTINYYSAVFQMWQHRVLDDYLWGLLAMDFIKILGLDQFQTQWAATKGSFDPRFVDDIEQRISNGSRREGR
jgi:hypothetical protein